MQCQTIVEQAATDSEMARLRYCKRNAVTSRAIRNGRTQWLCKAHAAQFDRRNYGIPTERRRSL